MKRIRTALETDLTEWQSIPFWSWNDKLEPEELRRQIRWMKEMGIGGFFMHARGGLKTPYLSEEWMNCIEACCDEAEQQGMHAWAYDENGWPSGFAGGKLLENMENHDRYILHKTGAYDSEATVSYRIDKTRLVRVSEGKTDGEFLNLYIEYAVSTADILNPDVVDQFIEITHEQYKAHFGEKFSKKLKGFFTDEPQYYRWKTPYTPVLETYFREQYQEDIFDKLGLLFVEKEGYREFRYRYWLSMQRLLLQNYAKKIYSWCEENGVQFTGHYIEENAMRLQDMCCGGVMPLYEYMHIPGIDWLGRNTSGDLGPRQLGSVARQLGKKHALTETFACCGWDVTPAELRRIAGFQYANGVNLMCQHLIPYAEYGQRKRDHPVHFSPINAWIGEHFREFNDYFTRLGYLLSTGEEPVNVAMLHPIRSTYLDYKREEEANGLGVLEIDNQLHILGRLLSSRAVAYHFLDETLLETHGFVKGNQIGCGKCAYDYLVIPQIFTMGKQTEHLLCEYVKNGGKVLLLDKAPEYLEGQPYDYSYLKSNCTLEEIVQAQPYAVQNTENELYYAYRIVEGKPFIFIQNASDKESYTQSFQFADGSRSFEKLDLISMETERLPLTVTLHENEALLLFPSEEGAPEGKELKETALIYENAEVEFETNYLTINVVQYSKDGVNYSEPMYRSVLFNQLLEERYEGKLWLKYVFDVQVIPEKLTLMAEQGNIKNSSLNGQPFTFTEQFEADGTFWMADITSMLQVGENTYETVLDWHQSEETYYALFGENVTESLKNCIVYEGEVEAVYLTGKFGVYSYAGYTPHDAETVCSHSFYIGEVPSRVSELTTDGFPFLHGKVTLRQEVSLDTENTILHLKGRYMTAKVCVNGEEAGDLLFDRRIDISPYAKKGINQIETEFVLGNRNFMGPFHHAGVEGGIGPSTFDICDLPRSQDGTLQYKLYRFYCDEESI